MLRTPEEKEARRARKEARRARKEARRARKTAKVAAYPQYHITNEHTVRYPTEQLGRKISGTEGFLERATAKFNAFRLKYALVLAFMMAYSNFEESGTTHESTSGFVKVIALDELQFEFPVDRRVTLCLTHLQLMFYLTSHGSIL